MDDMELFLNEQRADLTVFRITLQTLLLQLLANRPDSLDDLRRKTLAGLSNQSMDGLSELADRARQLSMIRGDEFFQELYDSVGLPPPKQGSFGTH